MVRHIRSNETYWFCRHCWQKMPNWSLEENRLGLNGTILSVVKERLTQFEGAAFG
ncbi:hypothetical protein [Scytonema sp. NUACC21]